MKSMPGIFAIALLFVGTQAGYSQGFVNLNFEDASIVPDASSPYYPYAAYASFAIPGWTATGFLGPTNIFYNDISLGAPSVSLFGTNGPYPVIDGAFSIDLYGGSGQSSEGASISQTGRVPAGTESLLFKAQPTIGTLSVTLGGQNLSFSAISTGPNYTLYGGNIPLGLAGQSAQLTFLALPGVNNYWEIDDIQFSPSPVPEPAFLSLFALCGLFLSIRRWHSFPP